MTERLEKTSKILLIMGQHLNINSKLKKSLDNFLEIFNILILSDNLCNYKCKNTIFAEGVIKGLDSETIESFLPEIIISFGCNFQERIKDLFRFHQKKYEHWSIEADGIIKDVFRSQTALFDCKSNVFLKILSMNLKRIKWIMDI